MIQRRQHGAVNAEVNEHAHQDDEGDGDPEFRFGEHQDYPFKDASTALSTDLLSGSTPVSRCTRAAARFARRSGTGLRMRPAATPVAKQRYPSGTAETRVHGHRLRCGRSCPWRRHDFQPPASPVRLSAYRRNEYAQANIRARTTA